MKPCNLVPIDCMDCSIDRNPQSADCIYGDPIETICNVKNFTYCQVIFQKIFHLKSIFYYKLSLKGQRSFKLNGVCRFCYQTPEWMHICNPVLGCKRNSWIRLYKVNCTVDEHVVCLGSRTFYKNVECNWTSGYKWNVALILSIFLGGFGVDRFYLGLYKVFLFQSKIFLSFF